jgi:hypothetical protein
MPPSTRRWYAQLALIQALGLSLNYFAKRFAYSARLRRLTEYISMNDFRYAVRLETMIMAGRLSFSGVVLIDTVTNYAIKEAKKMARMKKVPFDKKNLSVAVSQMIRP